MALRNLTVTPAQQPAPPLGLDGTPRQRQFERFGPQPTDLPGTFVSTNPADRDSFLARAFAAHAQPPAPDIMAAPSAMDPQTGSTIANALATAKGPGFFDKGGAWKGVLGTIGDVVSGMAGGPMLYRQGQERRHTEERQDMLARLSQNREDERRTQDRGWHVEDRDALLNKPEYFMSGRDRVKFDPASGQSAVVYDGPEDYQTYAQTIGLSPDSPDYTGAVQDYVLKGNGPTSQAARRALDTQRNMQRVALRATPTYAQTHPRPRSGGGGGAPKSASAVIAPLLLKLAQGGTLTPAERAAMDYAKGGSGRGRGGGGGASANAGLPVVRSPAEARQLPKGSKFQTPDGSVRVVQ